MGKKKRFKYLEAGLEPKKEPKKAKKADKPKKKAKGAPGEPVSVYLRRETVRAVWREVKQDGGESVSELVEDLLGAWLRGRAK